MSDLVDLGKSLGIPKRKETWLQQKNNELK